MWNIAREPVEERARAANEPGIEQRQQEFRVVGLEIREFVELAHLVTHDDAHIPERMQKRAKEALLGRPDAAVEQQQQVDVGVKAEMPAAVAAKGNDRDGTFRAASLGVKRPQQRVDAIGVLLECRASASATSDIAAQLVARRVERHPDGGAGARLRRRHEANISGCGCGCQALQAQGKRSDPSRGSDPRGCVRRRVWLAMPAW